jgi:hypothetical protein
MSSLEPSPPQDAALPEAAHREAAIAAAATLAAPARCKNCEAVLLGRFCVNCSQAADVHVPSTRELLHDLLEGLTHSDSRLWRTLKSLWFSPGKLTLEFIAGRRVAYLPPFRLYLVVSIIFFLLASLLHTGSSAVIRFDEALSPAAAPKAAPRITGCGDFGSLPLLANRPGWNQRIQHSCQEMVRDNGDNLLHVAVATMSKAMFIFLPLIAFLHMLMYWAPRPRYAEQLLFFVHLHAFYFSVAIALIAVIEAAEAWPKLAGVFGVVQTLLGWALPIYTLVAMRRVFERSWAGTIFKAIALFFVYMVVLAMTVAAVFVYAGLQL